jgi:hypothetical protein
MPPPLDTTMPPSNDSITWVPDVPAVIQPFEAIVRLLILGKVDGGNGLTSKIPPPATITSGMTPDKGNGVLVPRRP